MIKDLHRCSLLITGGAGFMGSNFIRYVLSRPGFTGRIVNLDALTYAANPQSIIPDDDRYLFVHEDICHTQKVAALCDEYEIDVIIHFAAETHVDRSIEDPLIFTKTNVIGTQSLLEVVKKRPHIHFHHISTDEVYGSVNPECKSKENATYYPNSPYSASKAASDHLVRSYAKTFDISVSISHASNNFGPNQYPEKLIPLTLTHCIKKLPIPVYGDGLQMRDWLYVDDHSRAIYTLMSRGKAGEVYNIGSGRHLQNIQVIKMIIQEFSIQFKEDKEQLYSTLSRAYNQKEANDYAMNRWMLYFLQRLVSQKRSLQEKIEREQTLQLHVSDYAATLLHLIEEHGKLSLSELVHLTGFNKNTTKKHVQELVKKQQVIMHGKARATWYTVL